MGPAHQQRYMHSSVIRKETWLQWDSGGGCNSDTHSGNSLKVEKLFHFKCKLIWSCCSCVDLIHMRSNYCMNIFLCRRLWCSHVDLGYHFIHQFIELSENRDKNYLKSHFIFLQQIKYKHTYIVRPTIYIRSGISESVTSKF